MDPRPLYLEGGLGSILDVGGVEFVWHDSSSYLGEHIQGVFHLLCILGSYRILSLRDQAYYGWQFFIAGLLL